MFSFALKSLRHRKGAFAGAFVALFCAAALVAACGMLLETGLRGRVAPERYAGAPVIVAGDQFVRETIDKGDGKTKSKAKPLAERRWIPATVADRLKQAPGVDKVVTEVTFPFQNFLAHGWESAPLTPFTIKAGTAPEGRDEVVVDARADIPVGAKIGAYTVVGVTEQALPSQDTIFFSTAEARRLAGRDGLVSAIGVFPRTAVATTPGAVAYTGDDRGTVEFIDAEKSRVKLISLGGAMGGTSLLVAILVVVGTFALSIQQRQRELALLRAVAATPRQIRKLIGGEALMVSLGAGTLGALTGLGLGFWLRSRFVALGAMPENLALVLSPFPIFAALLATVGAAWAAARVSARRTTRIRPVEALGDAALPSARLPWGRLVLGLLIVAGSVVLTVLLSGLTTEAASSPVTMFTALLWIIAVAVLGPLLARTATAVLSVPLRTSRVGGWLAAKNLGSSAKRLASVIVPLGLMVAMTCTILFVQTTMQNAAQVQAESGTKADYVIPGGSAAAVRKVAGVTAVTEVVRTSVRIGLTKYGAQAVTPEGLDQTMDLGVTAGSIKNLSKDSLAVSRTTAGQLGVKPGDTVRLTLGDGTPAKLTVAAVYTRGLGFGDITLAHGLVAEHVDDPRPSLLVAGRNAELDGFKAIRATEIQLGNAEVNYVAMGLIIAFAAIAVVNTLAMSTSDRSRELALLRLVGTTRRQVLRMLRMETLTAVLIATVFGSAIALATLSAFSLGMTGSAVPSVSPVTYLVVVAVATGLALIATEVPARLALRQHPAEAVGARQ
ncbi:FtsX-like permease family protein [Streptosporangium sp. NPDC002544]|uniref:FtsX-like permease family protein n=1 Tax=Streptosporangium sp. NPDC002544 TaxID=3154538 RepID=UPI00332AC57B